MKTYKEIQEKELLFKVRGENATRGVLNYVTPKLLKVFEGLEELQVLKVGASVCSGELLKKYKDKTDLILREAEKKLSNGDILYTIYLSVDIYSVYIEVKARFNKIDKNGFLYYDNTKYILNIDGLSIKNLYEFKELEVINEKEQLKTFNKCLKLSKELSEEKRKLKPYGLTDIFK